MKKTGKLTFRAVVMTAAGAALVSCSQPDLPQTKTENNDVVATIAASASTVAAFGKADASNGSEIRWQDGDRLGVFAADGKSQLRYDKKTSGSVAKATFSSASTEAPAPAIAYFPYSADNDGNASDALRGEIPAVQDMESAAIKGDYRYGVANGGNGTDGYNFTFRHMFTFVQMDVNADGTIIAGQRLTSVSLSASRDDSPVNLAGTFTFDAETGSYTADTRGSDVTMSWRSGVTLKDAVSAVGVAFPAVRKGDDLSLTLKTAAGYTVQIAAKSATTFSQGGYCTFPIDLAAMVSDPAYTLTVTDAEGTECPVIPETPEIHGSFTCATYNVDGLPQKISFVTINGDGPGSAGTKLIGQAANTSGWDFFGVSEDFAYNSELTAALTNYNHGTWRGSISSAQLTKTADTDGMNFFWEKNGVKVSNETYIAFTDSYGGLTGGANTCIKKGFRYYLVTLADGTEIDVYVTHMNTFSGSDITESNQYVKAVHNQTKQIANYIKAHKNGRPILFMGDTNMRYTRHKIKELLIDAINADSDLTIVDPWVDLAWGNDFSSVGGSDYPAYGTRSLMVSDAGGTSSTDIVISEADGGLQKGEVVDKVFYINDRNAKTQIKATKYLRDTSYKKADGKTPLADHYPIVVTFAY